MYPSGVSTQRWLIAPGFEPTTSRSQGSTSSSTRLRTVWLSALGRVFSSVPHQTTRPNRSPGGKSVQAAGYPKERKPRLPRLRAAIFRKSRREVFLLDCMMADSKIGLYDN